MGGLQIVGNATQIILEIKGHDAIVDQEHSMYTYMHIHILILIVHMSYMFTYIYINMFKRTETYIYVHVYRCMYIYIFVGKSDYARGVADRRERDADDPRDQGARRHCRPRARQHFPVPAPSTLKSPLKPRMYVYVYLHA